MLSRLDRGELTDPARLRHAFVVIDRQAERLSLLVLRMLDISQIDAGLLELHRRPVDVAALARGVVADAQTSARRRAVVLSAPPSLAARLDPERIAQVLRSLIDNALRFSPPDTAVEVEVSSPQPGTLRLTVRDHGAGMPPELRPQLFQRYFQGPGARMMGGAGAEPVHQPLPAGAARRAHRGRVPGRWRHPLRHHPAQWPAEGGGAAEMSLRPKRFRSHGNTTL